MKTMVKTRLTEDLRCRLAGIKQRKFGRILELPAKMLAGETLRRAILRQQDFVIREFDVVIMHVLYRLGLNNGNPVYEQSGMHQHPVDGDGVAG